jgi:hypothetical protein
MLSSFCAWHSCAISNSARRPRSAHPLAGPEIGLFGRAEHRLERRQRWCYIAGTHIDVDQAAALGHLVRLSLDLLPEILVCRQIGHIEAVARDVVFPAVIDAAQAAFFIAAEEQRGAAVRAAVVEHADPPCAVAEGDQSLAQQHQGKRVAVGSQLRRQAGRHPVLSHQRAHRGTGANTRQQFVFRLSGHLVISAWVDRFGPLAIAFRIPDARSPRRVRPRQIAPHRSRPCRARLHCDRS